MLLRCRPILKLTCGSANGGSTSFGGQKSSLLKPSENLSHVWRWSDLLFGFFCNWCAFPWFVSSFGTRCGQHHLLFVRAPPGRMVVFCSPFPVLTTKSWSRLALPNWHHMWGWGYPMIHNHAIRGRCLWGLSHRSLTAIQSLRPFRCPGLLCRPRLL